MGLFVNSKTRSAMSKGRAMEKRSLQDHQNKALRPYAELKARIDRVLLNIDQAKATITAAADETKKRAAGPATNRTPTTQTVAPLPLTPAETLPPLPPQWMPDPTGRHHYRYWDGQRWTAHASTNGQTVNDPIEP